MYRRDLLRLAVSGACLGVFPACGFPAEALNRRVLVLLELQGGNDSLNTFIPADQLQPYSALRPKLGLGVDERHALDDQFYIHSALKPLLPAWREGDLALVHGLGYPEANRSHFRSIEIWDTAANSDDYLDSGWLSQLKRGGVNAPVEALVFGRNPMPVMGGELRYLQLNNLKQYVNQSRAMQAYTNETGNPALRKILQVQNTLHAAGERLVPLIEKSKGGGQAYPETRFGKQLADLATVVKFGLGIPVYKIAITGFDTHRNQKAAHARLLSQMAEGLNAFREDMIKMALWDRVMVMSYSEFGRRATQNGSGGSDHGTAATHIVMGGSVKGGHVGTHPSLSELKGKDMQYTTDFRSLYQTVLSSWFGMSGVSVAGKDWSELPLV